MKNSIEQGIEQGIEQCEKNKQIEIAKEMLTKEMPAELISEITKLSINEINNLN